MFSACPGRSGIVRGALLTGAFMGGFGVSANNAFANDGGLAMGGTPRLLKGHPSVRMACEVIRITVGEEKVSVDCDFTFQNDGLACTVRMGFPDEGEGASDPDEGEAADDILKLPPKTTFDTFRSYVSGKAVKTQLIRGDKPGKYWHVKTVQFPAHSVLKVRDVYTQPIGGGIAALQSGYTSNKMISYILHTGSSWHGAIGRSDVYVTFKRKGMSGPLTAQPIAKVSKEKDFTHLAVKHLDPNTVLWAGMRSGVPTVQGKTVHFTRTNWRPTEQDDLMVGFDYPEPKQTKTEPKKSASQ